MSNVNYQPSEVEAILALIAAVTSGPEGGGLLTRGLRTMFAGAQVVIAAAEIHGDRIRRIEPIPGEMPEAAASALIKHVAGNVGRGPRLATADDGRVLISYGKPAGDVCSVIAVKMDAGPATLKTAMTLQMLHAFVEPSLLPARPSFAAAARRDLAPRVREVLRAVADGLCEKEVADRLGISRHTVHVYVKTLYKHFEVKSRAELLVRLFTGQDSVALRGGPVEAMQIPLGQLYPRDQVVAATDPVPSVAGPAENVHLRQLKATPQDSNAAAMVPSPRKRRSYNRMHARSFKHGDLRR
jgi:DNA-binding CsgD family transcriptional regulator